MRKLIALSLAALLLCAPAVAAERQVGRVSHVVDGDTLDVLVRDKRVRVRVLHIDAPEQRQAYGLRARQSLIQICGGEMATVDARGTDRNRRALAYVSCNATDAGTEQVRRGMAWVFERYAPADSPLYAVQAEAQAARRGLWADQQRVPPWEWRAAGRLPATLVRESN